MQLVVLDEADTLLEKGFKGEVEAVLQPLRSKPKPAVCALVVATFTQVNTPETLTILDRGLHGWVDAWLGK